MTLEVYATVCADLLLEFAFHLEENASVFHQDNAPICASHRTKASILSISIKTWKFPVRCLGVNTIENIWGDLAT